MKIEDKRGSKPQPEAAKAEGGSVWTDSLQMFWLKTPDGFFSLADGSGPIQACDRMWRVNAKVVIES